MIRNVLEHIGGIASYGVIAIGLFIAAFGGAVLWACLLRPSFLKSMSRLPLEDGESAPRTKGDAHHE